MIFVGFGRRCWLVTLKLFPTHSLAASCALARKSDSLLQNFLPGGMATWPCSGKWAIYGCSLGEREGVRKICFPRNTEDGTSVTISLFLPWKGVVVVRPTVAVLLSWAKGQEKDKDRLWYCWIMEPKPSYPWKLLVSWGPQLLLVEATAVWSGVTCSWEHTQRIHDLSLVAPWATSNRTTEASEIITESSLAQSVMHCYVKKEKK